MTQITTQMLVIRVSGCDLPTLEVAQWTVISECAGTGAVHQFICEGIRVPSQNLLRSSGVSPPDLELRLEMFFGTVLTCWRSLLFWLHKRTRLRHS